jgi:hypothetical protein
MTTWKTPRSSAHLVLLAAVLGAALAAACGGSAPGAQSPVTATPATSAQAATSAAPDAGEAPGAASASTAEATAVAPPASVDIMPSKMLGDVKALGIDLANAGDLSKMDHSKKKKLMPLFVKALGMTGCDGCHVTSDFKADTHNKRMATAMWSHFVRDLRVKGGGTLFCDSCHQGKEKVLARTDKKVLSVFMHANYEDKLQRADKKEHNCDSCHSDPFEGKIFAKLWKIAP